MDTDPARKLTAPEAAERIGLSRPHLAKLRRTGEGPPFFKIGRRVVYAVGDVDAWLKGKQLTQTPKDPPRKERRRQRRAALGQVEA